MLPAASRCRRAICASSAQVPISRSPRRSTGPRFCSSTVICGCARDSRSRLRACATKSSRRFAISFINGISPWSIRRFSRARSGSMRARCSRSTISTSARRTSRRPANCTSRRRRPRSARSIASGPHSAPRSRRRDAISPSSGWSSPRSHGTIPTRTCGCRRTSCRTSWAAASTNARTSSRSSGAISRRSSASRRRFIGSRTRTLSRS